MEGAAPPSKNRGNVAQKDLVVFNPEIAWVGNAGRKLNEDQTSLSYGLNQDMSIYVTKSGKFETRDYPCVLLFIAWQRRSPGERGPQHLT